MFGKKFLIDPRHHGGLFHERGVPGSQTEDAGRLRSLLTHVHSPPVALDLGKWGMPNVGSPDAGCPQIPKYNDGAW